MLLNINYSLSLETRNIIKEQKSQKVIGTNQASEQSNLNKQEIYENRRIYEIERKEEVYGLGILIMDILLGYDSMADYIIDIRHANGNAIDFIVSIPDELKKDDEITDIVEDCLQKVETRPTIKEVLWRLKRWASVETPEEKQVEYF